MTSSRESHAHQGTERSRHPDRARHADGPAVSQLLDAGAARRGAAGERLPAGAGEAALRAAGRVPRHQRALRPDRRVLPAPRRLAVVRPQRGMRAALPLPRLEVRCAGPVPRGAVGAGRERLRAQDQAQVLSAGRARRRAVDLHGAARASCRRCRSGSSRWCRPSSASSPSDCRSATGCRRWRAASIRAMCRFCTPATSCTTRCSRAPRATSTISTTPSRCSRWWRAPAGSTSARAATPRTATTTGASPSS